MGNRAGSGRWEVTVLWPLLALALGLGACELEKKGESERLQREDWQPRFLDWESRTASKDSDFAVLAAMESIRKSSSGQPSASASDSVHPDQVVDTNFVFPDQAMAKRAYAWDSVAGAASRRDTFYLRAYGNGLLRQEHPCALIYILSGEFPHPARWLKAGLKAEDIRANLGRPALATANLLRYPTVEARLPSAGDGLALVDSAAAAEFFFQGDSLFAMSLYRPRPCRQGP